jgi:hypothetical protein
MTQDEIKADIRKAALQKLGVVVGEQDPSVEDDATAGATLDRLIDDLVVAGDVGFTTEAIPEETRRPLGIILASDMADAFGLPSRRALRLELEAKDAMKRLRKGGGGSGETESVPFKDY